MRGIPLHWKIIIGLLLGIVWALLSSQLGWSEFTLNWIAPFGNIFISLLKLIAVPLVLFSIIKGVSGLGDVSKLGRIGIKTLLIYLATTVFAISIGLLLVNIIKPGKFVSEKQLLMNRISYEKWAAGKGVPLADHKTLRNDKRYASYFENASPDIEKQELESDIQNKIIYAKTAKSKGPLGFLIKLVPDNIFFSLSNNQMMLQVIFFAIFFGIVLLMIPQSKTATLISFIEGCNEAFLKMVDIVMKAAPFFVFALLAGKIAELAGNNPGGVIEIFKGLGWYSLVVVAGLAFIVAIVYPLLVAVITRRISYRDFFKSILPAQTLAFSSSSSAATLPVTIECVQDNLGVSKEISSFVLPIGATVNMDGTSLYQAVAVVFLAQFHMIDLSFSSQLVIVLTATLASIGSAAVPSAGLVMLIIVLESVGLNPLWIAIIFPVDRILDMCRTVLNVTGDVTVATLVAYSERKIRFSNHSNPNKND